MNKILKTGVCIGMILVTLAASLALTHESSSTLAGSTWAIETVDNSTVAGYSPSLAFDNSGNPAISYVDILDNDLEFALWDGTTWNIQTINSEGWVADETSLTFDSSGKPAISYSEGAGIDKTEFARWTGTFWSLMIVEDHAGHFSSVAINPLGNPAFAYSCYDPPASTYDYDLKFAEWTGTAWSVETVDNGYDVGAYASLAFDPSGNPAIAYYDRGSNRNLKFARWTGFSWVTMIVDSAGDVGAFASLAFDDFGNPAIAYYATSDQDLKFARWTGINWNIETIDSSENVGVGSSLAFDNLGNPAISYFDSGKQDLKFAHWIGNTWAIETVDINGGANQRTSLAFDPSGNPSIAYIDEIQHQLKFAHFTSQNTSPVITSFTANPCAVAVRGSIDFSAAFTDPDVGDVHTAEYDFGDGQTSSGVISNGTVTGSHSYTGVGVYSVTLTIDDGSGGVATASLLVAVYDQSAGFVTGGGWINSPPGAYISAPTLTGKANFGFVSKYEKGASLPEGQTEFQFKVADMNFHSVSYQWLVIAGVKAMYKGSGTINGSGDYGFMLSAIDADLTPSIDTDLFRIKIWGKSTGRVIYDNMIDAAENADLFTEIGGGNIVIHL